MIQFFLFPHSGTPETQEKDQLISPSLTFRISMLMIYYLEFSRMMPTAPIPSTDLAPDILEEAYQRVLRQLEPPQHLERVISPTALVLEEPT